jgi:hypothetical protein
MAREDSRESAEKTLWVPALLLFLFMLLLTLFSALSVGGADSFAYRRRTDTQKLHGFFLPIKRQPIRPERLTP